MRLRSKEPIQGFTGSKTAPKPAAALNFFLLKKKKNRDFKGLVKTSNEVYEKETKGNEVGEQCKTWRGETSRKRGH